MLWRTLEQKDFCPQPPGAESRMPPHVGQVGIRPHLKLDDYATLFRPQLVDDGHDVRLLHSAAQGLTF
eukprot:181217-Chlamydomonas_euryale.AAC.8